MSRDNLASVGISGDPPGPRGYPLIGVLPMLLRNPLQLFTDAAAHHGYVVGLPVGGQRFYLFNHPDHFKHILQERHRNYHKGSSYNKLKRLLGDSLATSEDDFWLRQRRLIQPAFHHQRLASMTGVMTNATAKMIERWQGYAEGQQIDITTEMMRLTQQIIVTTMFGTTMAEDAEKVCGSIAIALKYLSGSLWSSILPDRLTPGNKRFEQALQTLDSVVYRIIEERRRSGDDPGDLLSMLLQATDEESGKGMSEQLLRDEITNMFLAGHETTAVTATWAWHMLAEHPEVEARLHAELAEVLGGRVPTFQDLPQLVYTRMIIDEVLRLFPPAWVLFRTPLTDDVIGGYTIPAGATVVMSPYVLHRDPAFWEQPERFDPERFSPERSADRPRFAYVPFGGGPRLCIGNNFALMEAQLILAMIAQRYQLRSIRGHKAKPIITVVLRPDLGSHMTLHARSKLV